MTWERVIAWLYSPTTARIEKLERIRVHAGGTEQFIQTLAVFNDKLYGGTANNGKLFEWDGVDTWVRKAVRAGENI